MFLNVVVQITILKVLNEGSVYFAARIAAAKGLVERK